MDSLFSSLTPAIMLLEKNYGPSAKDEYRIKAFVQKQFIITSQLLKGNGVSS